MGTRRALLAGAALLLPATRLPAAAKTKEEEEQVAPGEDLMREHGVLNRALLVYEAWLMRDGSGSERIDNRKLATKEKTPTLGIGRRGDDFFFMLNGQPGLQKTIKNMPNTFRVMLYGFSTSQDEWEQVTVTTAQ